MRHFPRLLLCITAVCSVASVNTITAGPYSDDMAKCLVRSTTAEEKGMLVKWIFAIAAIHPSVSGTSTVTDVQRTEFSKATAGLFESLLLDRCKTEVAEALKYEGTNTIQEAFGVLGQAAMMELFSNAEVKKGLQEYVKYLDSTKMEQLLGTPGTKNE